MHFCAHYLGHSHILNVGKHWAMSKHWFLCFVLVGMQFSLQFSVSKNNPSESKLFNVTMYLEIVHGTENPFYRYFLARCRSKIHVATHKLT